MKETISRAVASMRSSPSSGDDQVYEEMVAQGIAAVVAARLVEFVPMAYCRVLLESSGVRFSNTFYRKKADGRVSERLLSSEPIWDAVMSFARNEVEGGVSRNDLLTVAGRSAEFDALNQLLNNGSKLSDIVLTPSLLTWPEDGP